MIEESNFLDELIAEAEQKEEKQTLAYFDLIVTEVARLEDEIAYNFQQSEEEAAIVHDWALKRNSVLQERSNLLRLKLEAFIRHENNKTIDLPRGTLKIRKMPDKVEITDMDLFLSGANQNTISVIPESIKADLSKIKAYIKNSGRTPQGVTLILGKEEFKLTIKSKEIL